MKAAAFLTDGFDRYPGVYTPEETAGLIRSIEAAILPEAAGRSGDLFAIRQLLKTIPALVPAVFTPALLAVLRDVAGPGYFLVKSIYFDKPPASNWYVASHQDLTISVDAKADVPGFSLWTVKKGQYAVQPPLGILENIVTVRIHLDDTDAENGALRVLPGSHRNGVLRAGAVPWTDAEEVCCDVPRGGVMVMKPLLLHRSLRATGGRRRRVIHLEFSNATLPEGLNWAEQLAVPGALV